ncbi:putative eukaryotic rRNA processing [Lupinus albus]|uniref:Putative eukaryotic rRNA processing n=1 Tax=Lupinus albus TaxID=3870 RepID=A0A6A4P967_LUPAL|nr:putative eukaryotic rRNA processing [Lupinus albus]
MGVPNKRAPFVTEDSDDDEVEDLNEEVSESESGSESEGDEDVKLTEPSKISVNNRDALLDKLGDISWPDNVEWTHKLAVDIDQEQEVDVNDDLARELAFYTQALEGTKQAFEKLHSTGQPFLRPPDYYAEMVKTDTHMVKVKGRLLAEKRKMEEADERRKARESKKLAKEIQAQKTKERAKQKKEDIESVKQWRKQRQKSGFASGGNDAEFDFEDGKVFERSKKKRPGVLPGDRSGGRAKQGFAKGKKPNRRESRDSKFGFGGRKGLKKQNTAETTYGLDGSKKSSSQGNKKRKR